MAASGLLTLFSTLGPLARIKLVIVGTNASLNESVQNQLRSLNPEHVSPATLAQKEISRRTPLGHKAESAARRGQSLADETTLALMRRWFWTRKPDAGFVLTDFPATLLQAKVLDEWLEARDESLDAVLDATAGGTTSVSSATHVIQHYRAQGIAIIDSVDFIDFIDQPADLAPLAA